MTAKKLSKERKCFFGGDKRKLPHIWHFGNKTEKAPRFFWSWQVLYFRETETSNGYKEYWQTLRYPIKTIYVSLVFYIYIYI